MLLEAPDRETREVVRRLESPITSALTQLANGYIGVMTRVRRPLPDPEPDWLSTAAETLRR